jgi:hypothetical protein
MVLRQRSLQITKPVPTDAREERIFRSVLEDGGVPLVVSP